MYFYKEAGRTDRVSFHLSTLAALYVYNVQKPFILPNRFHDFEISAT